MYNKNINNLLGIDTPLIYFFISKFFSLIAAPVSIFLISQKLDSNEQGYYFTFSSLLGISVFFELGLGVVITQFTSHEFGKLNWTPARDLIGDETAKHRILGLIKKSLFWYVVMASIMAIIIIPIGLFTLNKNISNSHINYILPWILLILSFSFNTALIPLIAFLEGCNKVAEVQKLRIIQTVLILPITWLILFFNGKLFVFFFEYTGYLLVVSIWIFTRYRLILYQIFNIKHLQDISISWKEEIFPMQWKIALSWLSAYFINYMFVPLLFHYNSSEIAGKMGMSLKITGYVYIFSMAWINTKSPQYGGLIGNNQKDKLKNIFKKTTLNALIVAVLISLALIVGLYLYKQYKPSFSERILPISLIILLCFANIINIFNSSIASYLRAYKKEPLLYVSLIMAFLIATSNLVSAKLFDVNIMILNYVIILFIYGIGSHLYIFNKNEISK